MSAPLRFPSRPVVTGSLVSTLALLLAGCSGSPAPPTTESAAATPSVLVQTTPARRRALPETLTLFGEVAQEAGASENISLARPVRLSRMLVSVGQRVVRGQPLFEVVTDPGAASTFQRAQSAVTLARKQLGSQQELFGERLTTRAQLAAADKALADAEAELSAQQQAGSRPGTQLVRASHDAVVASLTAQQGDRVQAGTSVLQLSRSGARRVVLGVEPEEVARLAPGMSVKLSPVFGGTIADGALKQVHAVINPQTRLVDVVVRLDGGSGLLPGQKVQGVVTLADRDGWVVPPSAVLSDDQGAYVFQVKGGRAQRVAVQVLVATAKSDGVSGAIDPALPIVVSGNYELEDGGVVRTGTR